MSIAKIALLSIDAAGMKLSGTPPHRLPPQKHIIPDWREKFLKSLATPCVYVRLLFWTCELLEAIAIIVQHTACAPLASMLTFESGSLAAIRITPLFLFGVFLNVTGTLLRVRCYSELGPQFTFELSLFDDHFLVGPYAVVRHPSYTALIVTIIGHFCSIASGSWVAESGVMRTAIGRALAMFWSGTLGGVILSLILRIPREDNMLQEHFGNEWDTWATMVPYRLIPGVY
ncbi:hypothetical protein FISHEDRAFT_76851 [Fistulina hepatica ATCC 64428]|uniref:Protein-S-isoprenylcysteine O-methyltransferase n=1 Tax=Fistulina hepatica ATCC 64428 TaxID=1128425 RepID=A0A0D7A2B0_9AGAR|nr:hypothetical protein FISHEDRAFT_76851 [Fistulina hepatica ATCC 64428]